MKKSEVTFLDIEENSEYEEIAEKVLKKCFEKENMLEKSVHVDILLTNAKHIRSLNKKYRELDKETDVLSFPMYEKEDIAKINNDFTSVLRRYSYICRTSKQAGYRIWT